ncbi:MAG: D-alanyl-D-alanine carboxypeptidase family protein [Patescibacteria group bacterium]
MKKKINFNIVNKIILVIATLGLFSLIIIGLPWQEANNSLQLAAIEAGSPNQEQPVDYWTELELSAEAAAVYNITTEEFIFEKKLNKHLPIASVTKLMTIITAVDYLNYEDKITIESSEAGIISSAGLQTGDTWRFEDLARFTLITSSNGGATAIARAAGQKAGDENFISLMNKKAKDLGLNNTFFVNSTGLDVGGQHSGSYSTAREITLLMVKLWQQESDLLTSTGLTSTSFTTTSGRRYPATNTNKKMDIMPGLVASKTGYTGNAGGNLTTVVDIGPGNYYVITVLGSTREQRTEDISKMIFTLIKSLK